MKDLRVIGNRDLRSMILVDNSTFCFLPQLDQGIPIIPFYFKKDDIELLKLKRFLEELHKLPDVPLFLKEYFQLHEYLKAKDLASLAKKLVGPLSH